MPAVGPGHVKTPGCLVRVERAEMLTMSIPSPLFLRADADAAMVEAAKP
jgi:hypothetical protein